MSENKPTVAFHYKKSKLFRVVNCDGASGGLTPDLNIFFALFNSRPPIPKTMVHELNEDGSLGEAIPQLSACKQGIVREVEVGIVMDSTHVEQLIEFLQGRLGDIKKIKQIQAEEQRAK